MFTGTFGKHCATNVFRIVAKCETGETFVTAVCTLGVFSPKKNRAFEASSKIFLHSDTYSRVVASMSECRTMDDVAVSPTKSHTLQISCRNLYAFDRLVFFQNAVFALGANPLDSCLPCKICASP